jgi:maleylacetate reductase
VGDPIEAFRPIQVERVYTGAGAATRLGEELQLLGVSRALLLTPRSLAQSGLTARVRDAAGGRIAAVFSAVGQHTPTSTVEAALSVYLQGGCDGVVAFGGGSVVDCAKAVSWAIIGSGGGAVPLVDLATGLSAAEFACSFGQTDDASRVKGGGRDPRLFARAVFLDPELTVETPAWLWFSTGFRAIDHAVECVLADNAHPYSDALALDALAILIGFPPTLLESHHFDETEMGGADAEQELRERCMVAAWMAHSGSLHINWGLSHQMGRQLGPAFNIPHGYTSAILLPAVVEVQSETKRERIALVEDAIKLSRGEPSMSNWDVLAVARGESLDGRLRWLAGQMRLPTTLREAGVTDRAAVDALFAGNAPALAVVERAW